MEAALLVALILLACGGGEPKAPKDLDAIDTSVEPSKRSEILAVPDDVTNSVVIFGGNDGPIVDQIPTARFREDTWVLQPGKGWTEATGTHPHARGRYAFEKDPAGRRALLFGGRYRAEGETGSYDLFNDVWAFDFDERAWTKVADGTDSGPDPRYYPASGWDADSATLYIWGGATNTSALSIRVAEDLWAWDGSSWSEIETSGDAPSPRVFFGSTWDPTRKRIIVFGGQVGDFVSQAYRDLYALDVTTGEWTRLAAGGGPSTRMHAHMQYDPVGDRYLLFGGHTDIGDANDLWSFDPVGGEWHELYEADTFTGAPLGCLGNPSEVPADYVDMDLSAPERRHRGMFALMWNNLWVFGGIHAECSDQLDDTWRYDVQAKAWHELVTATSGESCERRGDDCECLCL